MTRPIPSIIDAFMTQQEGDRLRTYIDSTGKATIGRGHTGPAVKPGMVITEAQSLAFERGDLQHAAAEIPDAETLTAHQYGALISFVFNVGTLGHEIPALLQAGRIPAIPAVMLQFDHAHVDGQLVQLAGLTNRRKAEVAFFNTHD